MKTDFNKAIFFDRDGVLLAEDGEYTFTLEKARILPRAIDFLKEMDNLGYLLFVITNQGGIGKGLYTREQMNAVNNFIQSEVKKAGIKIEKFLVCPHHPQSSLCICRKPDSLLLERTLAKYKLNKVSCWLIGDQERDVKAAEKCQINSIQVTANSDLFTIIEKIK